MVSKLEELSQCDRGFLLTIAKETNLSYRYYDSKNKSYLLNLLCNKFSYDVIKTIVDMYLLCYDGYEVAKVIKPNGMEKIANLIPNFFNKGEYLYEASIGRRICDVVILERDTIISIEVKSALDRVSRAVKQIQYYQLWSNLSYLVYDKKHRNYVLNLPFFKNNGIGLLEYSNESFKEIFKPKLKYPNVEVLLNFMTYRFLRKVARYYGIKTTDNKRDIISRLSKKITRNRAQNLFQDFLRNKHLIKIW